MPLSRKHSRRSRDAPRNSWIEQHLLDACLILADATKLGGNTKDTKVTKVEFCSSQLLGTRQLNVSAGCWQKILFSSSFVSVVTFVFTPVLFLISLEHMPVKAIQLGQVWRNDENGSNYLVTKIYSEVFTQYAILRQADANAANSDTIRVKVQKSSDGQALPGYTYTQEAQDF